MFCRSGAILPSASCPNMVVSSDICSSLGLAAMASRTLKIVPCASVCMSFASCVADRPMDAKAAAWSLLMAVPLTSVVVKLLSAVAATSGLAPAERKAAPSAATFVSDRPQTMATAPTRWMTSPSAGAVAFMLLERWFTASAKE